MSLVLAIIKRAHRESNLIAAGRTPTTIQQEEAFELLQNLIDSVIGSDVGENLEEWPLGNYGRDAISYLCRTAWEIEHPPINVRLVASHDMPMTVQMPADPSPGARVAIIDPYLRLATYPVVLEGNGRAIEGATSITLADNATNRSWLYREDLGQWVRVSDLELEGDFPFPREFDDYFAIKLAMRINPRFGGTLNELSLARLKEAKQQLQARYIQSAPLHIDQSLARNSRQTYLPGSSSDNWALGGDMN